MRLQYLLQLGSKYVIWNIRTNHMVLGLPSCVYFLLCCYKENYPHPWCQASPPLSPLTWYPGGPLISSLPFPVPDPQRPWGGTTYPSCAGVCSGHYTTSLVDVDSRAVSMIPKPPFAVIKPLFFSSSGQVSDEMVDNAAREVLLPPEECKIWLNHLQTVMENRRQGAKKAAATRKQNCPKQRIKAARSCALRRTAWYANLRWL